MHLSATRLIASASTAALLVAAAGVGAEVARFGSSDGAAADRLEREVRQTFSARAQQVQSLAERVSREDLLVTNAGESRDGVSALFARVTTLAHEADANAASVSATVYGPSKDYRVLAWSDGPAEDVTVDRLAGPPALFVARSPLGLLLVFVHPIEASGRRVGAAAAQAVLAPVVRAAGATGTYHLETPFGPVTVSAAYTGALEGPRPPHSFLISTDHSATPLIDVRFSIESLRTARGLFRRRTLAAAALPVLVALLLLSGLVLDRRRAQRSAAAFVGWSLAGGAMVALAGLALVWLATIVGAPPELAQTLAGLTALGLVAVFFVSWWWRRPRRLQLDAAWLRFVIEHLAAGAAFAALLLAVARLFHDRINAPSLAEWRFPLFPAETRSLLFLTGLLLAEIALSWAAAMLLAAMAARWRLGARHLGPSLVACALWIGPVSVLLAAPHALQPLPRLGLLLAGLSGVFFALLAGWLRRLYRRTTQAVRLMLVLVALLAPPIVLYPTAWFYADGTTRDLIERDTRATAGYPLELRDELTRATAEIDRIPTAQLLELVAAGGASGRAVPTEMAFSVWTLTSLSRTRVTSAVELYGANRALVSRFALNVPEYRTIAETRIWQGTTCTWQVFGEVVRFGAEEHHMLHAERGLCGENGRILGAVVVHLVQDYEALRFVSSANPYYDVLQSAEASPVESPLADLQVVVYGWSFHPVFTSGSVAWTIPPALVARLYNSRDPVWTTLVAENRTYHVYVANDSGGIYALGYPAPTPFEHLTRLAAAATESAVLFVILLVGAAVYMPIARQRPAPLRALFDEIRTSFYRKLFLFFVLAAVGPVFMLTLAFGTYMTTKFRDDVQSESKTVVIVARRVLEELVALQQRPDQPQATLTDDVMVWIGHVLKRDVNLFQGSALAATSQRDLFESGLLPVRTPAAAYRAIALSRLPTNVTEEALGAFRYLVAAAPVPARGPDAVLSVPLALRQRDIERDLDELDRGVLVGAVFVILFAAGLGASVARRISDPVARLTRATRQIAAGALDVRIVADTADELRRLVEDFNGMAATLGAQRAELARTNQLKAWAEMARQVAHEIKNPLTPIQLATEHLERVHEDAGRPLGTVFDQCVRTILRQVRLLRQIASEFSNFAGEPTPRPSPVSPADLVEDVVRPYRAGLSGRVQIDVNLPATLPTAWVDRTLVARALTNVVENAVQAMPEDGTLRITGSGTDSVVTLTFTDTGVGMDAEAVARAFEPYFSTKTAGSGLGLANAKRNIELCGGSMAIASAPGAGTTVTVTLLAADRRGERGTG